MENILQLKHIFPPMEGINAHTHERCVLLFAHLHYKTFEHGSNQAWYAWETSASPSVNTEPSSAAKQGLSCDKRWAKQSQARLRMLLFLVLTQVLLQVWVLSQAKRELPRSKSPTTPEPSTHTWVLQTMTLSPRTITRKQMTLLVSTTGLNSHARCSRRMWLLAIRKRFYFSCVSDYACLTLMIHPCSPFKLNHGLPCPRQKCDLLILTTQRKWYDDRGYYIDVQCHVPSTGRSHRRLSGYRPIHCKITLTFYFWEVKSCVSRTFLKGC